MLIKFLFNAYETQPVSSNPVFLAGLENVTIIFHDHSVAPPLTGPNHHQVQSSSPQSSSQTGLPPLACAVRPTPPVISLLMGPYRNTALSLPPLHHCSDIEAQIWSRDNIYSFLVSRETGVQLSSGLQGPFSLQTRSCPSFYFLIGEAPSPPLAFSPNLTTELTFSHSPEHPLEFTLPALSGSH